MSAIPTLSFLASMASQYPPFQATLQKAMQTASPPAAAPANPPPAPPPAAPVIPPQAPVNAPSAPVNIPSAPASNPSTTNTTPASSPPNGAPSNLCEHCHTRAKFFDGTKTHPYCGKGCAVAAAKGKTGNSNTNNTPPGNCVVCHTRPKYFDGTKSHSYCSKSCAQNQKGTGTSGSNNSGPAPQQSAAHPNPSGSCQIPGCSKAAHKNASGNTGKYCTIAHKTLAETACLFCRKERKQGDLHFCGRACADEAQKLSPAILEVPDDHVTFRSVEAQFKTSWRHSGKVCPTVRHVYKIVADQSLVDKYDAYRAAVESRGQFVSAGRSAGNENRRWHGTKRECQLGDKGHAQFCSSTSCSLCCIMRTSYDVNLWGKKTGWGRFGAGIYTSSTSSKSNDYSTNTDAKAPLKAILLNKVVVGKGYKLTRDNTTLSAPPAGFDSVLAEKGSRLNHDELVVYTNDAIRPSYLVMYDSK